MTEEIEKDEITLLKERADLMGIKYHSSIGLEALKKKVEGALPKPKAKVVTPKGEETIEERNLRIRNDANRLVRVRISNMNPIKGSLNGDFYEVSNRIIGTIKKYVPFNAGDDGWHVPNALLQMLQDKKYLTFYEVTKGRKKIKRHKLVKEFNIQILPPLTQKELKDLATVQAAAKNLD